MPMIACLGMTKRKRASYMKRRSSFFVRKNKFHTPFHCSYLHLHTFLLFFHKKKSRASGFFFLYSSLFSFHSSLFSEIPARLFQRRDKREERKEKVAFLLRLWRFGRKALIFSKKCVIIILRKAVTAWQS